MFFALPAAPNCTIDTVDLIAGDNVKYTCDVVYTTNLSPMTLTWTDPLGLLIEPDDVTHVDGHFRSVIVVEATVPYIRPYNAHFAFDDPNIQPPASAQNKPAYVYDWNSPVVDVQCTYIQCVHSLLLLSTGWVQVITR